MAIRSRSDQVKKGSNVLLTHPFELGCAAVFIIAGVNMGLVKLATQVAVGFLALPAPLILLWAVMIVVGGALMIAGSVGSLSNPVSRGLERAGLILASTAFGTLALTLGFFMPMAWASWSQPIVLALACLARHRALRHVDHGMQRVAEEE